MRCLTSSFSLAPGEGAGKQPPAQREGSGAATDGKLSFLRCALGLIFDLVVKEQAGEHAQDLPF